MSASKANLEEDHNTSLALDLYIPGSSAVGVSQLLACAQIV